MRSFITELLWIPLRKRKERLSLFITSLLTLKVCYKVTIKKFRVKVTQLQFSFMQYCQSVPIKGIFKMVTFTLEGTCAYQIHNRIRKKIPQEYNLDCRVEHLVLGCIFPSHQSSLDFFSLEKAL